MIAVFFSATQVSAQDYQLSGPDGPVRAGYFVVEASMTQASVEPETRLQDLRLQQSASEDFQNAKYYRYFGDFSELTATGVPTGDYYLRLVDSDGQQQSNVIQVTVEHYPLWQALTLFLVGLLLFSILVVTQLYFFVRTPTETLEEVKHE